ncbi:MAG: tRNA (guanosine(46)-N7)-methyltransferase TrmB [Candidatus Riflebacteria bacterium]|nr:tRNA (guanosine(46)-N7)-methyltransferase TrmB [Candidatus Riflebacteria bacterium]
MRISKLEKYRQIAEFSNVIEPSVEDLQRAPSDLYDKWNTAFFKRVGHLVLEVGCGQGDLSLGLARRFPERNFLGLDVKGARIWRGARTALDEGLKNVGFLRIEAEFLERLFAPGELNEIWITFPTPYLWKPEKMLVSPTFLSRYRRLLAANGILHIKTDVMSLANYVCNIWPHCGFHLLNLTNESPESPEPAFLDVCTRFEATAIERQKRIWHIQADPVSGNVTPISEEIARFPWNQI